jgi:hypothetical protein
MSLFINSHNIRRLMEALFFLLLQSQFLVKNKYAAPGKVAISGASNGGQKSTPVSVLTLTSR